MHRRWIGWGSLSLALLISSRGFGREEAVFSSAAAADSQELDIRQVQRAAILYAEVSPEKIVRWRALARIKALLPRLTVDLDRDRNRTVASATSGGKTTFSIGPEDESLSVGLSLTWDFGELIWNPDQTSIDSRSRLTVKLRKEILEEVTKLYFERKRLLTEFEANPTEDEVLQRERQLRVGELTAQLDALTGGYFSKAQESN